MHTPPPTRLSLGSHTCPTQLWCAPTPMRALPYSKKPTGPSKDVQDIIPDLSSGEKKNLGGLPKHRHRQGHLGVFKTLHKVSAVVKKNLGGLSKAQIQATGASEHVFPSVKGVPHTLSLSKIPRADCPHASLFLVDKNVVPYQKNK